MHVQDIINAAADDADDFLSGVSSMTEARAAIREYLGQKHPAVPTSEHARIVAGVLAILDDEGFFDVAAGGEATDSEEPQT